MTDLRPRTLAEYVGQPELVAQLGKAIRAAKGRNETLGHTIMAGPPGLGKTTAAGVIAAEMGGKTISLPAPAIESTRDVVDVLTGLRRNDVLFIDEIHRLPIEVEEVMYSAMEDFEFSFKTTDKRVAGGIVQVGLPRFTLVGATTRSGDISRPLESRFQWRFRLDFYPSETLGQLAVRSAEILGFYLDEEGGEIIGRRSKGTPRETNRLVMVLRDHVQLEGKEFAGEEEVEAALAGIGVDENGLNELDRRYMRVMATVYAGGPAGLDAMACTLQEDVRTISDTVEPYLLRMGYLARKSRGRVLTDKGKEAIV